MNDDTRLRRSCGRHASLLVTTVWKHSPGHRGVIKVWVEELNGCRGVTCWVELSWWPLEGGAASGAQG